MEGEVVRWEGIVGRESLRVLLAESDRSTREIVAALLRKCGYQVASAPDGLRAWEILEENQEEIDLILMEVELPLLSGFELLTKITENDSCKRIPVIMMSSHDYIGMVFKYMLKGAADFLVKPLRKNELRNLWQHVWRRYSMKGVSGEPNDKQDDNVAKQKSEADLENAAASDTYSACTVSAKKRKEWSDKGSDAQSSCTCPGKDDEGHFIQNMLDYNGIQLNGTFEERRHATARVPDSEQKEFSAIQSSKVLGCSDIYNSFEPKRESFKRFKPCKTTPDFLGVMNKHVWSHKLENIPGAGALNDSEVCNDTDDPVSERSSLHELELSLRINESCGHAFSGINRQNILNHSHMSAFSRYNKKSNVSVPLVSIALREQNEDIAHKTQKPIEKQTHNECRHDLNGVSQLRDKTASFTGEDTSSTLTTSSNQLEKANQFYNGRIASHVAPTAHACSCAGFFPSEEFAVSPQLGAPPWMIDSTMKAIPIHVPSQSGPEVYMFEQNNGIETLRPAKDVSNAQRQIPTEEIADYPSSIDEVEQGNSINCVDDVQGSVSDRTENVVAKDVPRSSIESPTHGAVSSFIGIDPIQIQRSIHREAALNKFRQKRKERCFEKKVRYQSRQKLAEQRPRVKGQFVRQGQPNPGS